MLGVRQELTEETVSKRRLEADAVPPSAIAQRCISNRAMDIF